MDNNEAKALVAGLNNAELDRLAQAIRDERATRKTAATPARPKHELTEYFLIGRENTVFATARQFVDAAVAVAVEQHGPAAQLPKSKRSIQSFLTSYSEVIGTEALKTLIADVSKANAIVRLG